jgi:hypothetical protein
MVVDGLLPDKARRYMFYGVGRSGRGTAMMQTTKTSRKDATQVKPPAI